MYRSSDGGQQWDIRYDGLLGSANIATAITVLNVNQLVNIYVTGKTSTNQGYDIVTIKYVYDGLNVSQIWAVTYDGPANAEDFANAMVLDLNGNIYVSGASAGVGTGLDYVTL